VKRREPSIWEKARMGNASSLGQKEKTFRWTFDEHNFEGGSQEVAQKLRKRRGGKRDPMPPVTLGKKC